MSGELRVLYRNRPIGRLIRGADGILTLDFDDDVVTQLAGETLLSVTLPVRREPYRGDEVQVFLDGLLPEESIRERLCRRFSIDLGDSFELLRHVGGDCAGALSFVEPNAVDEWRSGIEAIRWLDESELYKLIDELPLRPLGDDPEQGIRISLAGAQNKLAVIVADDGRIGLPLGRAPSTHILKPPSSVTTGSGRPAFPSLVENELFGQRLARNAGFPAAEVTLRYVKDLPVLLVARYDRVTNADGRIERLHQEDACQALRISPKKKYQGDGGPGIAEVVDLLRLVSTEGDDALRFIERVAFNVLVGNNDSHGKNTSLVHSEDGIRMAPMYDVLSTVIYDRLDRKLAMRLGGQWQWDQITTRHWSEQLNASDFGMAGSMRRLASVPERLLDNWDRTLGEIRSEGVEFPALPKVRHAVETRAVALRALPGFISRGRRSK